MHDAGRQEAAAMTAEARRQVEDLSKQRDAIAAQLQRLHETLAGLGPLAPAPAPAPKSSPASPTSVPGDEPTQALPAPGVPRGDGG